MEKRFRLAAYGVCQDGDQFLLARFVSRDGAIRHWALPGGGVEHGEDPYDAVVREVAEETGYQVEVERLLGISSRVLELTFGAADVAEWQMLAVFYAVRVVGGVLTHEVNGSTDQAAWFPASEVVQLERSVTIDIGLDLHRSRPDGGHLAAIPPITGLLRR